MSLVQRLFGRGAGRRVRGAGGRIGRAAGKRPSNRRLGLERLEERMVLSDGLLGWVASSDSASGVDVGGNRIALDAAGNVYVAGYFKSGDLLLTPIAEGYQIDPLTCRGGMDAFVAKLNPEGKFVWARQMGGPGDDVASGLAVSPAGDVYVGGRFAGTASFGNTSLVALGKSDIFVTKLDTEGNFCWAVRAGGSTSVDLGYDDSLTSLALGSDNAVYLTGRVLNQADFVGLENPITTVGGSVDAFLAKLTETAEGPKFQWVQTMGDTGSDIARTLAIGTSESDGTLLYVPVIVGPTSPVAKEKSYVYVYSSEGTKLGEKFFEEEVLSLAAYQPSNAEHYLYVATVTAVGASQDQGTLFKFPAWQTEWSQEWRKSPEVGSDLSSYGLRLLQLAADDSGVYATGTMSASGPVDFDPDPARSALLGGDGGLKGFVWKLDHDGDFLAARVTAESSAGMDRLAYSNSIAVYNGAMYTTGRYVGDSARFDTGTDFAQPPGRSSYGTFFVLKTTQDRGGVFGRAFLDVDGYGTWEARELPLPGFTVSALVGETVKATAVTQKHGQFCFPHLTPGVYNFSVELPQGWTQTAGGLQGVTVEAGRFVSSTSADDFRAYTPNEVTRYISTDVPKEYPKQSWRKTTSLLNVPDSHLILGLEVSVTISGPVPYSLALIAPDGTTVWIPRELYKPDGTFTYRTDAFNFANAQGTWALEIAIRGDTSASRGKVTAWSLDIRHPAALPSLAINDVSLAEGNSGTTAFNFTVTLSRAVDYAVTVMYATANGTATAGSDYRAASGTLTIPRGATSGTITVLVNGDTIKEPDETFYVNLSNAEGATIRDGQGLGTILNDDKKTTSTSSLLASAGQSADAQLAAAYSSVDQAALSDTALAELAAMDLQLQQSRKKDKNNGPAAVDVALALLLAEQV